MNRAENQINDTEEKFIKIKVNAEKIKWNWEQKDNKYGIHKRMIQ